jgi:predicted nucleic acid-binding protein
MSGYWQPLLLDWSAYARVLAGDLSAEQRATFEAAALAGELVLSPPFRLEARHAAPGLPEDELDAFPQAPADGETWRLAEAAQQDLGERRVALPALLVAALAHQHGLGVLHYDADFDALAGHTTLAFEPVWIAPPGSLG